MSQRNNSVGRGRIALTGALTLSMLGCMQAAQTTAGTATSHPSVSGAGSLLSAVATRALSVFESETVSLALDRIDQRELPLDKTYRRTGTGEGVVVYVFDGGVQASHPELAGRVRKGFDAFPNDPAVCNAHGTAVAGAVAGQTLGVAPEVEIVDVKMVECGKLRGTIKAIVDGAKWVIEDAKQHGRPAIANWSFIADTSSNIPALDTAVSQLRAAGIPVVVSAGNLEINACRVAPGNAKGAIVVGASAIARRADEERGGSRIIDRRAPHTAYGPCVDVYAPGDSVLLPSFDASQTSTVQLWNGTSMSAGYVSGAIALYFQLHPGASPDDALLSLRSSATVNVVHETRSPLSWLLYVGSTGATDDIRIASASRRQRR